MIRYVVFICFALLCTSYATHGETDSDRLARLERQLATLSKHTFNKEAPAVPASVPMSSPEPLVQSTSTEEQIQRLVNRIEELEHHNQVLSAKVEELSTTAARPAPAPAEVVHPKAKVSEAAPQKAAPSPVKKQHEPTPKAAVEAPSETPAEVPAEAVVPETQVVVITDGEPTPTTPSQPQKASKKGVQTQSVEVAPEKMVIAEPEQVQTQTEKKTAPAPTAPEPETPDSAEIARIHAEATAHETLPLGSTQEQYDHAIGLLKAGNYEQAATAFQAFLTQHAEHDLAANATYWLGESYFARDDIDKAAVIFAQGYQVYGKGSKGPDMLLKIAMCLEKQGKPQEACVMLDQLKDTHKVVSRGIAQGAQKLKQRLKCT